MKGQAAKNELLIGPSENIHMKTHLCVDSYNLVNNNSSGGYQGFIRMSAYVCLCERKADVSAILLQSHRFTFSQKTDISIWEKKKHIQYMHAEFRFIVLTVYDWEQGVCVCVFVTVRVHLMSVLIYYSNATVIWLDGGHSFLSSLFVSFSGKTSFLCLSDKISDLLTL